MTTAVYLGNDTIQILSGKVSRGKLRVKRAYSEPIAEGVMINGIITNEALLSAQLRTLKKSKKLPRGKVNLVVDSGDILTKTAIVPIVDEKKMKKLVAGEFAEATAGNRDKLYDYSVLLPKNPNGSGATILCTAADKSFVESYIDLFTKVNKNISSIRLGLDCVIKRCATIPELSDRTYIILLPDGNALVSILFVNGSYFFSQRTRLLEDRGTPESAKEFDQRVNYITQFNKAQNSGGQITHVYLGGLAAGESELPQELAALCGMTVARLPGGGVLYKKKMGSFASSDYCYTVGCLL